MYWTTGSGRIELNITKRIAAMCAHPGDCERDVLAAMQMPSIRKQLSRIDADTLAKELKEYGAWDEDELKSHHHNLTRILWIACGDITDKS